MELEEEELHYPNGQEDIKIIPVGGTKQYRKILLGAIGGIGMATGGTFASFNPAVVPYAPGLLAGINKSYYSHRWCIGFRWY